MPFIFPKRFLRPRDVLDPYEFNQDKEPIQELLDGELDRHNFNAERLKALLPPHESEIPAGSASYKNAAVSENAYYEILRSESEVPVIFESDASKLPDTSGATPAGTHNKFRSSPNFLHFTGSAFRNVPLNSHSASNYTNYTQNPHVVANTGDWDAVSGASVTVQSGKDNLYINAFVQYVWQGFFEYKPPWRYEGVNSDTTRYSYMGVYNPLTGDAAQKEAENLNQFGPSDAWVYWPAAYYGNPALKTFNETTLEFTEKTVFDPFFATGRAPFVGSYPYAYPLNEASANDEARRPQLGGFHHISKGFYPCLVQFAIRVDGKVIEETITGKSFSFEESAHGLRVSDSSTILGSDGEGFVFGQRSSFRSMDYSDNDDARPGQKLRSSRATSCGPEVLPVRIGAVIPVSPGTHTVEIVARRLLRKRKKFEVGDFVGVFTRRLNVAKLPIYPIAVDSSQADLPVTTRSMQSEDLLEAKQQLADTKNLESRINSLSPSDIKKHSLPNTHLPSKITNFSTVGISPSFSVGPNRELTSACIIRSRFPGMKHLTYLDRRVQDRASWAYDYTDSDRGAGWVMLHDGESGVSQDFLSVKDASGTSLHISENEKMLIFADVEVRGIRPELSADSQALIADVNRKVENGESFAESDLIRLADFYSFLQQDKYLDLFALFNIGYRTGNDSFGNWVIGSKHAPAVLNSSSWANRKKAFMTAYEKDTTSIVATQGGNISSETGITSASKRIDLRGANTAPNNLGITVPLMFCLDASDFASESDRQLTEIGVFGCTTFPFIWDSKVAADGAGTTGRKEGSSHIILEAADGGETSLSDAECNFRNAWMSPARSFATPGRPILNGVEAHIGRCRLTIIKMLK